ncbi:MAG: hypothetical protein EBY26_03565 [Microbacteriaceae bacterium]|nr:hypothetical protein [Microbacteriaceae bacterium]
MFNAKKIAATVAIFGVGFAAFSTGSAVQADPVASSFAIVGSDTLEDVVGAIVNGTSITGSPVRVTQNGSELGSFDATGTKHLITKTNGVRFARPNGSGDGYMALSASMGGQSGTNYNFTSGTSLWVPILGGTNIQDQVDISRSSSGDPKAGTSCGATSTSTCLVADTDPAGTLARIPFGRDAIALAFSPSLASKIRTALNLSASDVPFLSAAQLGSIYKNCDAGQQTITVGSTQITIQPWIPQAGSGTRKDFLGKLDPVVTDSSAWKLLGETVVDTAAPVDSTKCIKVGQEHDASSSVFAANSTVDAVMPMSASRWIAMKNGGSLNAANGAVLGGVATATTTGAALVSGNAAAGAKVASPVLFDDAKQYLKYTANPAYYNDSAWGRDVYLFVQRARIYRQADLPVGITSAYNAALATVMTPYSGTGLTVNKLSNQDDAFDSNVGSVKAAFGFLPASSQTVKFYKPVN